MPDETVSRRSNSDFTKWAAVNHKSTLAYNASTPDATVFASKSSGGCVLTPDNADGPYFVQGEKVRTSLVENQVGVPVHLELQFLDISTCKPIESLLVDTWSCNSTGVYSGVSAAGEGGLGSTYLRGVAPTDADGVVAFDTLFPGHYSGRANHIHVITHAGATQLANGSYSGGHINHLSQLFFDQSLVDSVEATSPYSKNTIARTSNAADLFTGYGATPNYDPFPQWIQLGSDLSGGLFMWLEMAVNLTLDYDSYAPPAAYQSGNTGTVGPQFAGGAFPWAVVEPPPTHG
jgi:protocatechuate 3,4-dioxygenase beta subunit